MKFLLCLPALKSGRSSRPPSLKSPQSDFSESTDKYTYSFHRDEQLPAEQPQTHQSVLLLREPRRKYELDYKYPVPVTTGGRELLIRVHAVGLNPVDWKSPDFNFGIPALPFISGRDFVGTVIQAPATESRIQLGDVVIAVSTDYRDLRKAGFQQFAVASDYNVCRLPRSMKTYEGAPIGVAFVAAALGLGICFGTDFSRIESATRGPDLFKIIRALEASQLPPDVRRECLDSIRDTERPKPGEWVAVWGGSSTTGSYVSRLAKLLGFRVILVVDVGKHGERLSQRGADLLVDSHNVERAIDIIRAVTNTKLRFAFDCVGKETATQLLEAFETISDPEQDRGHLIALSGLPKTPKAGVVLHTVPVKVFHEVPALGESLMIWLEKLLEEGYVTPPDITLAAGGLAGINDALDQMRLGEISGRRLVVEL
ncbi:MAG: hypothetical protein M1818_003027 [Claussenomyces sp. TS43310]|nr:MAG: hypothetical protein M1818_003027 [Claussenomyces sp. TS43310]